MSITKTQRKLIAINVEWCELEKEMGENAALEVACNRYGVDSQWFYDKVFESNNADVLRVECEKLWGTK